MDQVLAGLQSALEGRYTLERELGRGGMATVYLAHDHKHARPVAFKILHPELAASLGPERFLREIRLTASLQHPHILTVLDSGETIGQLWYTMPYVDGESLRDRLNRETQLPLDDALQIARNVLAALAYAHSHAVIHRDIKPENILLESGEAVVADFGIARAIGAAGGEHLTQTGMAVGTPAYMSPEQAAGGSELDGRSDVYSVGCVLYEMLAGEPPYTGPTPQAIMAKRFFEPVPHLRTLRDSVPEPVEQAVAKALAKVPADRFATASQFAEALAPANISGPVQAGGSLVTGVPPVALQPPRNRRSAVLAAGILVLLFGTGLVARGLYSRRHPAAAAAKMLAVLPFENLGPAEDEYFADGLTEEITSRLASVSGLGVISRTSAMHYKKTTSSLKEVGRELGAGYVLEGSVRWEKLPSGRNRIRVTPQLIEVSDDRHLWAERYDAELADIFQVQGEIAAAVTSGLDVALRTSERADLAAKATVNPEAYLYYLRANERAEHQGFSNLAQADSAVRLYQQAITLDPRFAVAYAELSQLHSAVYFSYYDRTTERLAKAKTAVDRAVRLQPDLPETHLALGRYYQRVSLDYDRALAEFTKVLERQPNNSDALWAMGTVQRRQGKGTEGIANMKRAAALDPRDWGKNSGLAEAEMYVRAYADAIQYWDRAIALRPDVPDFYAGKALAYLDWDGTADRARQVVREALTRVELGKLAALLFFDGWGYDFLIVLADIPTDSLARLPLAAFGGDTGVYLNFRSQFYNFRHEVGPMRRFADSARAFYEQKSRAQPEDPWFHLGLGFVDAELGRKDEAIREGERAVTLRPVAKDAKDGATILNLVAQIYMMGGEPEKAIDRVQYLLSIPSGLSAALLRVDPIWDPLRDNPRFQRLLHGSP